MDIYRFRSKARIVAIVDLILTSMSLWMCLILLAGAVVLTTSPEALDDNKNDLLKKQFETSKTSIVTVMWLFAVVTSIATIIQIIAAIKLLNATQLGKEPSSALRLCMFWRHVCVVFTCLLIFGVFFSRIESTSTTIFQLIQVFLRVSAIVIVTKFMSEVEQAVATGILPMHFQQGNVPIVTGVAYAYVQQNQPPVHPEMNVAPPSYQEVVKEHPPSIPKQ